MEKSLPLHVCHVWKSSIFINRLHGLIQTIAIAFLIYYRASFLFQDSKNTKATVPTLLWVLVFASELLLSFIWLLGQAYQWRPVSRTVFPERLPHDDKLPPIDVFICTVDPNKEPTVQVMNTVLSAMALDYPAGKLNVYLSDDGGAAVTLHGMREAWKFAKSWLPFCKKYGIKTRCPKAYFSASDHEDHEDDGSLTGDDDQFVAEKQLIQEKYEEFKEHMRSFRIREDLVSGDSNSNNNARQDHPAVIEVIQEDNSIGEEFQKDHVVNDMPLLVYVSREKRTGYPHHFKAGALNVLLRVSGLISNSPYILVLDCDMYCNDPTSARQVMCFHFDPKISSSLSFVQFPQRFDNISKHDIYDSQMRSAFGILWQGLDGLRGPVLSGTCFYIKRESLYGDSIQKGHRIAEVKDTFGSSNEFINSLRQDYNENARSYGSISSTLLKETRILASCAYPSNTKWGEQVGFLYHSVCEDVITGFILHCRGWISVYLNPSRPQFLGTSITSLNDLLIQGTRWSSGLVDVGLSKFCPLIYGTLRMSVLESMCYAEISFFPLFYCLSLWCFATIPQLCLLNGIPLYPQVSSSFFAVFAFIFASAVFKHLYEVLKCGGSIQKWTYEQSLWMMKSVTTHTYGSLDAIMKRLGAREASFLPSNKAADEEKSKLYQMGKFDFKTSSMILFPMVAIIILNMASFVVGVIRIIISGNWDITFLQILLSFYILVMNYAIIEGMTIRNDTGCIPLSVTLLSIVFSLAFFCLGSVFLMY